MGRLGRNFVAVMGAMLLCAAVSAQTTHPAVAVPGKYEEQPLMTADASAADEKAATSQPAISISSPDQLDFTRVALAMGIVIAMILGLRWVGKKYFPNVAVPRSSSSMKVLSRLVLSPKQQLLMIQVGKRIVVVGDSTGKIGPISEISDPDEVAGLLSQISEERSQQSMKGFGALFHRAGADFDEKQKKEIEKPASGDSRSTEDAAMSDAHEEFNELADKVRLLSAQFRRSV